MMIQQVAELEYENKLLLGKNMEYLPHIPDNTFDEMVTDPPYGYGLMGLDWDKALPSVEIWRECFRVMKPGAFGFVLCTPRQDCLWRMMARLEEAGFVINFTSLYWVYATGLIKAADMSKSADRRMGAKRPRTKPAIPRTDLHGDRPWMKEAENGQYCFMDDQPITDEAKALHGAYAGYQPKPALECILVVMKPLDEKTYIGQALENGKGVTWLGDLRIPFEANDRPAETNRGGFENTYDASKDDWGRGDPYKPSDDGRCAANLIVSDDALNDGQITVSRGGIGIRTNSWLGNNQMSSCGDRGSFSRYFDLDRWAIEQLPQGVQDTFPCLVVPKPSKREKDTGVTLPKKQMYKEDGSANSLELIGSTMGGRKERRNIHPTCKPVRLFGYLTILGSRRGDLLLDPYMGSGTSMIAARALGRSYTGMEMDEHFHQIAEQRCSAYWKYARFL